MFKIYDGRAHFFQWDINQKLIVSDPTITEVHFCNRTDDCALVCEVYEENGQRLVNVPNILLTDNWTIRAYGYCGNCYTKQEAAFKVAARSKPSDYIYTETEIKNLDELTRRLEMVEDIAQGAVGGETFLDYEELVNELNAAEQDKYYVGQHFLIKTLGVPDLWVYEVAEAQEQYEYTTDEALAEGVVNSLVQIGYYVLSALETQKVDLNDYVKNTDYATTGKSGVVKGGQHLGVNIGAGIINIMRAEKNDIDAKTNYYKPIVPAFLDYAVKVGLTTNTETLTDEERAAALEWLGALPINATIANKGARRVYGIDDSGNQTVYYILQGQGANFIPMTDGYGCLYTADPRVNNHAASKQYVDNLFNSIVNGEEVAY